jgi:uncharacterized protein YjbJ (UPF0337 family)
MKNTIIDRVKGKLEEVGGTVQKAVGGAIGNDKMAARGANHELVGEAKQVVAKAAGRIEGAAREVAGSVQSAVGEATDNPTMAFKGKVKKAGGKLERQMNTD